MMRERVAFDAPTEVADGYGGTETGWAEQFTCHAEFIYSRGGETVEAARRAGREAYKVKIRNSPDAKQVKPSWRMWDVRRGTEYDIQEADDITDPMWVYLVAVAGGSAQ